MSGTTEERQEGATTEDTGAEEVKLTDREVALAKGEDPDDVGAEVDDDAAVDGGEEVCGDAEEGDDDGKEADSTDETDPGSGKTWLTDEIKALAGTYGLGEDDLADFDDERDFLRFARVLEKRGSVAKKDDDAAPSKPVEDEGKKAEAAPEIPRIDPEAYKKAGYEDEVVNLARVAALMQERLDTLTPMIQQQQQQQHQQVIQAFDTAADTLERYGKSGS